MTTDHPDDEPAVARARRRAIQTRDDALRRVDEVREQSALVDAALDAAELDRRRAGSLLAGGIAFRVFLWLLPAALLIAAITGLTHPTGATSPDRVAKALGLAAATASTVQQATERSSHSAAVLIVIAVPLLLGASTSLVRALRVAHVMAWEEPFRRRSALARDGAIFSVSLLVVMVGETAITYLRHQDPAWILLSVPVSLAIIGGGWLGLSLLLPHGAARWPDLLPGAALVAGGHAVLQVVTVLYLAPKLARAPALYGSLGAAATVLLWLFLLSRLLVAAAFLNATLWRNHQPSPGSEDAPRRASRQIAPSGRGR